jgi:hypothetical protein
LPALWIEQWNSIILLFFKKMGDTMKPRIAKINLILPALAMLLLIAPQFALGNSELTIPPDVAKDVSPQDIYVAGTGSGEETTVTITVTGAGGTSTTITPLDVVFAIDSTGSMTWNDLLNLRLDAAKDFVDKMDSNRDQAGVVSWDTYIDFTFPDPVGLSSDFTAGKYWIDQVDSSGGTSLNAGLYKAIDMLDAGLQTDSIPVIIFLTDGAGTYTPYGSGGPASVAAAKGYIIYSIGLGSAPNAASLQDMANNTGGTYYPSPSAENLQAIFDAIFDEIVTSTIPCNVDVIEKTQNYIVDEGSFNITPDDVTTDVSGVTTIIWSDIGSIYGDDACMSADEEVILTFTARSKAIGNNLPVEFLPGADVCYDNSEDAFVDCVPIPQAYINVQPMPVALDIKPGSCPNALGLTDKGVLPAAILGTEDFDVTMIDPATVRIRGVAPLRWAYEDVATPVLPFTGKEDCNYDCTTEMGDAYLDLALKFKTQEIIATISDPYFKECVVFTITGYLKEEFGGVPFIGEDVVSLR